MLYGEGEQELVRKRPPKSDKKEQPRFTSSFYNIGILFTPVFVSICSVQILSLTLVECLYLIAKKKLLPLLLKMVCISVFKP